MPMKLKLFVFVFVLFSFFTLNDNILASTSNGTIDLSYHYAWGENIGWVDFADIIITDTALSGSAYGENIGWIDLSTVANDGEGNLSGYAWGENVGWVDFSKAVIGSDGVFTGGAYGENVGWIIFGIGDNKVATDWRPASTRSNGSSSGSRSNKIRIAAVIPTLIPTEKAPTVCLLTLTLRQGNLGEQVKCLQTKLNITSDGIFGPITKSTVINFQKANLLVSDGIVGPMTRAKLQ